MKLVRDRIPEIVEAGGNVALTRTLDQDEFVSALGDKLLEEAAELIASTDGVAEEAADILEVLAALCKARGVSMNEVAAARAKKAEERGTFDLRVLLMGTRPSR